MSAVAQPSESYGPSSPEQAKSDLKEQGLNWKMLAAKLGVSVQSVAVWRKMPGAPLEPIWEQWEPFVKEHKLGEQVRRLSGFELREEKTKHEIELIKAKVAKEQRRVIDREEVNQLLLHIASRAKTMLYQFLETEAPPKLDGLPAAQMRPILREMADSIADEMAGQIERFQKQ